MTKDELLQQWRQQYKNKFGVDNIAFIFQLDAEILEQFAIIAHAKGDFSNPFINESEVFKIQLAPPIYENKLICSDCGNYKTLQGDGVMHQLCMCKPSVKENNITDKMITKAATDNADKWAKLGYSRSNAYDYFIMGAKFVINKIKKNGKI